MNNFSINNFKVYYEVVQIPLFLLVTIWYINTISWAMILLGLMFGYMVMVLAQEIGGHRYFSHHAFELNSFWERITFASMIVTANGSPLDWRIHHLEHHHYSDTEKDPTSPRRWGLIGIYTNYWKIKYKPQLTGTKALIWVNNKKPQWIKYHNLYFKLVLLYQLILLLTGIEWFIAFVCIPVLMTNIYFNSISAFCHQSKYREGDELHQAVNNFWVNILSPGAGQHKEHHNKPGLYRSENFDVAAIVIDRIKK